MDMHHATFSALVLQITHEHGQPRVHTMCCLNDRLLYVGNELTRQTRLDSKVAFSLKNIRVHSHSRADLRARIKNVQCGLWAHKSHNDESCTMLPHWSFRKVQVLFIEIHTTVLMQKICPSRCLGQTRIGRTQNPQNAVCGSLQ